VDLRRFVSWGSLAIQSLGAQSVFIDLDLDNFAIDPERCDFEFTLSDAGMGTLGGAFELVKVVVRNSNMS
jgi:hypothetical protein